MIQGDHACLRMGDANVGMTRKDDQMFYITGVIVNAPIAARSSVYAMATEAQISPSVVSDDEEEDVDSKTSDDNQDEDEADDGSNAEQKQKATTEGIKTINIMEAHYKYNHCSEALLKKTLIYYGLKSTGKLLTCHGCMTAKGRRVNIPKKDLARATKPAQRLQLDLSGPFFATTAGSKYWLKIMCQFSRKCFDYFLREKSEVVFKFEHLLDLLTAANFTVEFLRCDDAGEHQAVETLCEKRGVTILLGRIHPNVTALWNDDS